MKKMKHVLIFLLFFGICFTRLYAGHTPEVSDKHKGKALKSFEAKDIHGKTVSLADLKGKPFILDVFASWCPPCQYDLKHLEKLYPDFQKKGVQVIGILADPEETPDTVDDAVKQLLEKPLPFQAWLINDSIKKALFYEGFPAIYFIDADGKFSTTVFGMQEIEVFQEVVKSIIPTDKKSTDLVITKADLSNSSSESIVKQNLPFKDNPFSPLIPINWKMWHPIFVHFPIVLLIMEAILIFLYWIKPRQDFLTFSKWLLVSAVISFAVVSFTGIRDVGIQLGSQSPFISGFQDRADNFFQWKGAVSLHVIYGATLFVITIIRLFWRLKMKEQAITGKFRIVFGILTIFGLIILFGAGQVGGSISHY